MVVPALAGAEEADKGDTVTPSCARIMIRDDFRPERSMSGGACGSGP